MAERRYTVVIEADDSEYHAYCPAVPGCHTWAPTVEQARAELADALQFHLQALQAAGIALPEDGPAPVAIATVAVAL